jgi:hypothetical protein
MRAKTKPDHMFVKPKFTRDPSRQNLDRVYSDPKMPMSNVPVGAYMMIPDKAIGDPKKAEAYRVKLKTKMGKNYNMLKLEDKNRQWIDVARKDYIAKVEENK